MPGSDEKSGLAQSIDALFSQAASPPAVHESVAEPSEAPMDSAPPPLAAGDATVIDASVEPDPFDSLEEHAVTADGDPHADPSFGDDDSPLADGWESAEVEQATADGTDDPSPAVTDVVPEVATEAEADVAAQGEAAAEAGPAGDDLAVAVDDYLGGSVDAADDILSIAATLQERLALDPLADAVERLAEPNAPGGEGALDLAQKVANPAVASRLVQRMSHEEDEARREEYLVLARRLGTVMANAFRGALAASTDKQTRRACYDGMVALGDLSRPVLEGMIDDENSFLVLNGVAILGEMGGDGAVGLVTSALANTDARVRCEALASLAKLGGEDSGQLVMASLEDADAKVRAAAARAAGELGVERSLKPILALLDDAEDTAVAVSLLEGLGSLGDPGAVQAIEKKAVGSMFSKSPTEVRVAAYRALHDIGTPHAREVLGKAREDKDPVVRTTVRALTQGD